VFTLYVVEVANLMKFNASGNKVFENNLQTSRIVEKVIK